MRKGFTFMLLLSIVMMALAVTQPAAASGLAQEQSLYIKLSVVSTSYQRSWNWELTKVGSVSELTLPIGQVYPVDYTVTATGTPVNSNWTVSGKLNFRNMTASDVTVNEVSIDLGGVVVYPTCRTPAGYPPVVHAGYVVECTYTATVENAPTAAVSTIKTVELGDFTNTTAVTFGSPLTETGTCITVTDTQVGDLGGVCGSANPTVQTFQYTKDAGPYDASGEYTMPNTATIVETGKTADWNVAISVPAPHVEENVFVKLVDLSATFERTWDWTITKTGSISQIELPMGTTAPVDYTVTVTGVPADGGWAVSGTIPFENLATAPVTIDSVLVDLGTGIDVVVECTLPATMEPGQAASCTFSAVLPDNTDRTAAVTVTTSTGKVFTVSGPVTFGAPATETGKCITVTDTLGGDLGGACGSSNPTVQVFQFTKDVGPYNRCDLYPVPSTATIVENGRNASWNVDVTVPCENVGLNLEGLTTTFNRTWDWNITKVGSLSEVQLAIGETKPVDYTVTVTGIPTDGGWAVSGPIALQNLGVTPVTINSVQVDLGTGINVTVTCTLPVTLQPGESLNCSYAAVLSDNSARTATVTVTTVNNQIFTSTAAVTFGAPSSETGKCITVTDTLGGSLGGACGSANPTVQSFQFTSPVGPYNTCGLYAVPSTATIVENGRTAGWNVNINVPCPVDEGCTLTQGYWKTHSRKGPARYDDAWKNIGSKEEQTLFFKSGKSWYSVFHTSPSGNVYYILAHQYMAAKLNVLNGASAPAEVTAALASAEALFEKYTPSQVGMKYFKEKDKFTSLASLLDSYNNGEIGPGHCDDNGGNNGGGGCGGNNGHHDNHDDKDKDKDHWDCDKDKDHKDCDKGKDKDCDKDKDKDKGCDKDKDHDKDDNGKGGCNKGSGNNNCKDGRSNCKK